MNINTISGTALLAVVGLVAGLTITSSLGTSVALFDGVSSEAALLQALNRPSDADKQKSMLRTTTNILVTNATDGTFVTVEDAVLVRYNLMKTFALNNPAVVIENAVSDSIRSQTDASLRKYVEQKVSITGVMTPTGPNSASIKTAQGTYTVISSSPISYDETIESTVSGVLLDNILVATSVR